MSLRGLALVTACFVALWVVVPGFLTGCLPPPRPQDCPWELACEVEGWYALTVGSQTRITCEFDPDRAMGLNRVTLERQLVSAPRPSTLGDVSVLRFGPRPQLQLDFQVPADGEDWQSLDVTLEFQGCYEPLVASLGGFRLFDP